MLQYLFFIPSFFVALCLLNILISVLSDGYTNEQESATATFLRRRSFISMEFFLRPSCMMWGSVFRVLGRKGSFVAALVFAGAYVTMILTGLSAQAGGAIPLATSLFVANQFLQIALRSTPSEQEYLWIAASLDDDYEQQQGMSSSRRGDRRMEMRMARLEEQVEEMSEVVRRSHALIKAQCDKESNTQLQLRQIQALLQAQQGTNAVISDEH